ncbi:hypothetical protein M0805_009601 [Coniferiporia weirii]|nr:hypothetical protein M0805_009601 [Coniferiporia weirii]
MSSRARTPVTIAPTTPTDLPAVTECELLAFSGAFRRSDRFSHLLFPFRVPLVRAGVHPRRWPGFAAGVRRHARWMRDGLLLFTAFVPDEDGGGGGAPRAVGMAALELPRKDTAAIRMKKGWTEKALEDYVYPSMDTVQDKLLGEPTGVNVELRILAKAAMKKGREEYSRVRDCYIINLLFVHPHFERRGVGSALLAHCTALADAAHMPLYLEATGPGAPLYAVRGFETISVLRLEYRDEIIELPIMVREPKPMGVSAAKDAAKGGPVEDEHEDARLHAWATE